MAVPEDEWSKWLLDRRHGGDPDHQRVVQAMIERIRDRVLDGARLEAGMTLADIGTGDGLIAFGAIARVGPSLRVILHDISVPLLQHAQQCADLLNVRAQCSFLTGSAEHLGGLNDATVDVVTTRAVLAYVADRAAALREFYRVLKSGGRISLAEPIFRDQAAEAIQLTKRIRSRAFPSRRTSYT
jgi:arsenite methyltransferase